MENINRYFMVELLTQAFAVQCDTKVEALEKVADVVGENGLPESMIRLDLYEIEEDTPASDLLKAHPYFPAVVLEYRLQEDGHKPYVPDI